jgi:DNA-binding winged helix-turn-helix (wHTH) protein
MKNNNSPYWVADYYVEASRNQVTWSNTTYPLQPKVLAVLNVLAMQSGKVVSHEELMNEVWPDTYVSPNTLQRCIAELRKIFKHNPNITTAIKTHSKQGYSLELEVRFRAPNRSFIKPSTPEKSHRFTTLLIVAMASLFSIYSIFALVTNNEVRNFDKVTPLTATDEKEYYPNYSPDGKYLVFHRYLGVCDNHIWAKDLVSQREIRLTQESAVYGQHSWSSDGTQLAFTKQKECSQQTQEPSMCWELHTLDFASALQSPQKTIQRLDCGNNRVSRPRWMNDGSLLMMEHGHTNKLVRYHPATDSLADFFIPNSKHLTHYDFARGRSQIAVFEQNDQMQSSWSLLDKQGQVLSSTDINFVDRLSVFQKFEPNYNSTENGFIVNTTQGVFELSFSGLMHKIPISEDRAIYTPVFNHKGTKLLAARGTLDADVTVLQLTEKQPRSQITRSNEYDAEGRFQPDGSAVAFISKRSGHYQIWVADEDEVIQISKFEPRTYISSLIWAPDGNSLATVTNDRITILSLRGDTQVLDLPYRVNRAFQWVDKRTLLVTANYTSAKQLLLIDTQTLAITDTAIENPKFAHVHNANSSIFYIDKNRKAWLRKDGSEQRISSLDGYSDSKVLVANETYVYGVNRNKTLWEYNLTEGNLSELAQMPDDAWWVSDKRDNSVLLTTFISSHEEIVEMERSH